MGQRGGDAPNGEFRLRERRPLADGRTRGRPRTHTHLLHRPEKYLETELAEELRDQIALLEDLDHEDDTAAITADRIANRLESARDLLSEFDERGTTIGAKEIDGRHIVELPVASFSNVKPFEELILYKLGEDGEFASVSELAESLARELNEEYTDSFRSKVIYNVDRLGPGGKVHRTRRTREVVPNAALADRRTLGTSPLGQRTRGVATGDRLHVVLSNSIRCHVV